MKGVPTLEQSYSSSASPFPAPTVIPLPDPFLLSASLLRYIQC